MRVFIVGLAFAALAACTPPAPSETPTADAAATAPAQAGIVVTDAWAAPTPGGATVAAGYVTLSNPGRTTDRLVSATSPRAASVEMHTMEMEGDVMRMRPTQAVEVPAKGEAKLAPGGTHLMFVGVTGPFVAGETVPVQLVFEQAGAVEASFAVRERTLDAAEDHGGH